MLFPLYMLYLPLYIPLCWSHYSYKRSFEIFSVSVVFMNLEEGFPFKFAVQIFSWMPCRFRFLLNVLMLIPSNVNIPNGFTNACLLTKTRFFINLARWVRVLNKLLTFLVIHLIVTWNFWLVNWRNSVKNRWATSSFYGQ